MSDPRGLLENGLPNMSRYMTTIDSSGSAIVAKDVPSESTWQKIGNVATFFLGFTTRSFPVSFASSADIKSYVRDLNSPPGLTSKQIYFFKSIMMVKEL